MTLQRRLRRYMESRRKVRDLEDRMGMVPSFPRYEPPGFLLDEDGCVIAIERDGKVLRRAVSP